MMECEVPNVRFLLVARFERQTRRAFTLIEIMVVIGIMGIILAAGIPSLYYLMRKEGMRKVTSDLVELCGKARAQAILRSAPTDLVFRPLDHVASIGAAATTSTEDGAAAPVEQPQSRATSGNGSSVKIPDDYVIEMLDVNLWEYNESEFVRVRFYPNGMSDEMTLILRSPKNEWKKISLEATTGLASVDEVRR